VLLDTATFLWMATADSALSERAASVAADPGNDVFLSVVSGWEIAIKHRLGRLPLPDHPSVVVPQIREDLGVESLALDEEACLQESRLPALHRDPFDRMLVCQAIVGGLLLLTPDRTIQQYPVRTVW
jgi:PIN domain nuclease of toxin-antitoxin system